MNQLSTANRVENVERRNDMAMQQEPVTLSAQEKWAGADQMTREKMLNLIGWSPSFATTSWKKLPHMVKVNLSGKTWTK